MMSYCVICAARGVERRAAPVKEGEGVALCILCRNAPAPAGAADVVLDQSSTMMLLYGERLSRQAGGLAPAPASTTVPRP